jgi:hypothetical protein
MNTTDPTLDPDRVAELLAAPFPANEVRWKPQSVSGNRALAICYIDARAVIDRLDDVLGIDGWTDAYEILSDGSAVCTLRVRIGEAWVSKQDVGGPSEQPDEGDRRKAAFSDALKRAAVKWGIGRYLYRLPSQWVDYDPQKRRFIRMPTLPPSVLPPASPRPTPSPQPNGPPSTPAPERNGTPLRNRTFAPAAIGTPARTITPPARPATVPAPAQQPEECDASATQHDPF